MHLERDQTVKSLGRVGSKIRLMIEFHSTEKEYRV